MYPAYLIRAGIDWTRHHDDFKGSNPYNRCIEAVNVCRKMWQEQRGVGDLYLVEPAAVAAYWSEFFSADDPLPDETEWRDGLMKRSAQYDSFEKWQEWFKTAYASVYEDDIYWMGVLTTSWAHTHQFEVMYSEDSWEFKAATPYLQTSEFWKFEPHMDTVSDVLREVWLEERQLFEELGFNIEEQSIPYLGRPECLDFDTKRYLVVFPPRAERDKQPLELGEMVADLVLPAGDNWYRAVDTIIFAHDYLDATALIGRFRYLLRSKRRFMELSIDHEPEAALLQASAEGWQVALA